MIGWLYRMLVGRFNRCDHDWKLLGEETVMTGPNSHAVRYTLQCKHCGEVTLKTLGI